MIIIKSAWSYQISLNREQMMVEYTIRVSSIKDFACCNEENANFGYNNNFPAILQGLCNKRRMNTFPVAVIQGHLLAIWDWKYFKLAFHQLEINFCRHFSVHHLMLHQSGAQFSLLLLVSAISEGQWMSIVFLDSASICPWFNYCKTDRGTLHPRCNYFKKLYQ